MEKNGASFGLALSSMCMTAEGIGDFLEFPEFDAVELPCEIFTAKHRENAALRKRIFQSYRRVLCGGIMDSRLTGTVPFADRRMRTAFVCECEKIIVQLAAQGIHTASLECPVGAALANSESANALREILLMLAGPLNQCAFTLLLPVILPDPDGPAPERIALFMRNLLIPNIKLRIDVHPWRITGGMTPKQLCGHLNFETRAISFRYDADCGNRVLRNHLKPWLAYLAETSFSGPALLCPFSQRNRMALAEAELFAGMIADLREDAALLQKTP